MDIKKELGLLDYEREIFECSSMGKVYLIDNFYNSKFPTLFLGYSEKYNKFYIFNIMDLCKSTYCDYLLCEVDLEKLCMIDDKEITYKRLLEICEEENKLFYLGLSKNLVYEEFCKTTLEDEDLLDTIPNGTYLFLNDGIFMKVFTFITNQYLFDDKEDK